jgi:hypothetical protein
MQGQPIAAETDREIIHQSYHAAKATCEHLGTPQDMGQWFKQYSAVAGTQLSFAKGCWGEHFANSATDDKTGKPLRLRPLRAGPDKAIWTQASREEYIRSPHA